MNPRLSPLLAGLLCLLPAAAFAQAGGQERETRARPEAAADTRPEAKPEAAAPDDAEAAPETAAWAPRTGDALVDARLADINVYAARFPDAFVDELVRYFDAPRPLIEELLGQGVAAGDLYYACALARVTGRPCRGVIGTRQADGGAAGWEPIARRFGVEPGDARARRLREGIAESYAHWGRPLPGSD